MTNDLYRNCLASCILGTTKISGRDYFELVFLGTTLSADELSQMRAAVSFSIGVRALWYESRASFWGDQQGRGS